MPVAGRWLARMPAGRAARAAASGAGYQRRMLPGLRQLRDGAQRDVPDLQNVRLNKRRLFVITFRRGRWAPHTQQLYEQSWRDWLTWCEATRTTPLPAEPAAIAAFIVERAETLSTSSISLRIQAIVNAHKIARAGLMTAEERERYLIDAKHPLIADAWTEVKRQKGTAGTPKRALSPKEVQRMVSLVPEARLQERAILLLTFASAMRRSEVAALNVEDLEFTDDSLVITIRRSKTDKSGRGETVAVARTGGEFCPVAAVEKWIDNSAGGPVFFSRLGNRMAPRRVAEITKRWAKKIGLDPREIGAHSHRRGCITAINEAGINLRDGMALSRHRTPSIYLGYVQKKSAADNPAVLSLAKALSTDA